MEESGWVIPARRDCSPRLFTRRPGAPERPRWLWWPWVFQLPRLYRGRIVNWPTPPQISTSTDIRPIVTDAICRRNASHCESGITLRAVTTMNDRGHDSYSFNLTVMRPSAFFFQSNRYDF